MWLYIKVKRKMDVIRQILSSRNGLAEDTVIVRIDDMDYTFRRGTSTEPYVRGEDLCLWLGYTNYNAAMDTLKPKYKKTHNGTIYVSEPGLYKLLMDAKTRFAEKFNEDMSKIIVPIFFQLYGPTPDLKARIGSKGPHQT